MRVYLNSIDGVADAFTSLLMSRRTWTREKEEELRRLCDAVTTREGFLREDAAPQDLAIFAKHMNALLKWGVHHITLLKFIDLSFTVEGMHRGGQDDWDSHAERFHNRIIRSSTRLADFYDGEVSEWYKDKIVPTDEALSILHISVPDTIEKDGVTYVKGVNGYIRQGMENEKDVKRGLYMLSIPSNFIFRCDLANFSHVYKQRGKHGGANPEVKQGAELMADLIEAAQPKITREVLLNVEI